MLGLLKREEELAAKEAEREHNIDIAYAINTGS
jgi:hypothetical protein